MNSWISNVPLLSRSIAAKIAREEPIFLPLTAIANRLSETTHKSQAKVGHAKYFNQAVPIEPHIKAPAQITCVLTRAVLSGHGTLERFEHGGVLALELRRVTQPVLPLARPVLRWWLAVVPAGSSRGRRDG